MRHKGADIMYKVIIAEDEDIIRKGLMYNVDWAELDCCVVAEVKNGIEGIEAIRENIPDIVIVDINMPVMGGLDMIRLTYETYDYSAIILSGYSNFEYAQRAIAYGVLGYLSKPLNQKEFREAIVRAKKEREVKYLVEQNVTNKTHLKQIDLFKDSYRKRTDDNVVDDMLEYIYHNYDKKILMEDIVARLNYSETFLNRKFKEAVGTTYIEYLNRYRIQKAIELLKADEKSIQEIAWKCGVGDYKYFGTVFKKYVGCSPKEYMNIIRD